MSADPTFGVGPAQTAAIAAFVREVVPYERDPHRDHHNCPAEELVAELKAKGREAGVMTPHIMADGCTCHSVEL